jgi:CRISPR-associated endonuclease/helicase Cas3
MSTNLPTFTEFFTAVNGHTPFPWQVRAAELLARREVAAVTVPTGLGKSALIDAAVWAAAHGAWRRIAYVVDRRIVVDAVHDRAQRILQCLKDTVDPSLRALADILGESQVVRLRGGVHGDDDWVLYPDRLSVVLSTVDQIGSRLLFRGYGVSPRRWPMHAAFFASDTLVIIDEAHLSAPFVQTLDGMRAFGAGIDWLPMSATLARSHHTPLQLEEDDLALPVVRQRLHASKMAQLVEVAGTESAFINKLAELAEGHLQQQDVRTVAVIVNQVKTARQCYELLSRKGVNCVLLIGRNRPAARDRMLAQWLPRLDASRERKADEAPLVVVATQTIEVGADFDFDALVTESAPLSALRQRFGRLDRLGLRGKSTAHIMRRAPNPPKTDKSGEETAEKKPRAAKPDPVYGPVEGTAWAWLQGQASASGGSIDFGLMALQQRLDAEPPEPEPQSDAAVLLPTHLELLAQTGVGVAEFDLAAWLHGPSDRAPDVALIWRDDLLPDQTESWPRSAELLPPLLRESMAVPSGAVRRWLLGQPAVDLNDLQTTEADNQPPDGQDRPVLRWRGADVCEVISARQIRPGDTLLVPSVYGGCDEWGWAPGVQAAVNDLADTVLAEPDQPRCAVARLVDGHDTAWGADSRSLMEQAKTLRRLEAQALEGEEDMTDEIDAIRQSLLQICAASSHPLLKSLVSAIIEPHPNGIVLRARGLEEVEGIIETGSAVTLDDHHDDVARWAARLAATHPEKDRVVGAAKVHDAGKAERRMQMLLHGNLLSAQAGPLLAKSAQVRRADQLAALRASQLPRGFRHEFASLSLAALNDALTRHLVATHHGHGRPWGPACADPQAEGAALVHLDSRWARQWAELVQAQGPWRLAEMEWLLRAADARASMEEAAVGTGTAVKKRGDSR